jgi:hypothetical protein
MPKEWNADGLLELARRYRPACILTAAADLDLFDIVAGGGAAGSARGCTRERRCNQNDVE